MSKKIAAGSTAGEKLPSCFHVKTFAHLTAPFSDRITHNCMSDTGDEVAAGNHKAGVKAIAEQVTGFDSVSFANDNQTL